MTKHRILVVNEDTSRDSTVLLLQASGYEVSTARHGLEAVLQLKYSPIPDLILSDLTMTGMSGFEFLSVLRQWFPEIPVIACSETADDSVAGGIIADDVHTKLGSSPNTLLKRIADLLATSPDRIRAPQQLRSCSDSDEGRESKGIAVITCTNSSLWV